MKHDVWTFAALALLGASLAGAGNAIAQPQMVGSIGLNEAVFWDGGKVEWSPLYSLPQMPSNAAIDRCELIGPCFEYRLEVTQAGASALRIALDTAMRND